MRNYSASIAMLVLLLAGLAACGQTGPLFLPGDPSQIRTDPPSEQQGQQDDDEDEDDDDPPGSRL